jgi:hypothetical protein
MIAHQTAVQQNPNWDIFQLRRKARLTETQLGESPSVCVHFPWQHMTGIKREGERDRDRNAILRGRDKGGSFV